MDRHIDNTLHRNCTPLVSVIIPSYNHAPFLRERVECVLSQTFTDFEVIILDDCSTDNSARVLKEYSCHDKVSHVVLNEVNTGNTFLQWERGVGLAVGKYIWIAESDDVADHTFLSELVDRLEEEPDAVLAFSRSRMIGPSSEDLGYSWDVAELYHSGGLYDGPSFCKERLVMKNLLYNASMIVWRRELFAKIDDGYKQYRHCGDWWFWFEVCMRGKVIEVPKVLNGFRQHPDKVSNSATSSGKDFEEMGAIQTHIMQRIGASVWQKRVLRGRMTKRLLKHVPADRQRVLASSFPDVFGGSCIDVLCYTLDKMIHLSGFMA